MIDKMYSLKDKIRDKKIAIEEDADVVTAEKKPKRTPKVESKNKLGKSKNAKTNKTK